MKIQNQLNRILSYFHRPQETAKCAKERLQIIIAHERGERNQPEYLPDLQKDILAVIAKYVDIRNDDSLCGKKGILYWSRYWLL